MKKIKRNIPEVANISSKNNVLTFKISNVNVSFVNALRRTMLTDIKLVVFKTTPYEENLCIIEDNTCRLNNEILKQRLSCIPIHIDDFEDIENLQVEVNVENTTDSIIYVTTEDFKIKNVVSDKYLSDEEVKKIFPPDGKTKDHIIFTRLRPKVAKSLPGEKINFKCKLSISTAKENGSFNVLSTCAYYNEDDIPKQNMEWDKYSKGLDTKDMKKDIKREKKNWFNHKAKKYFKDDAFNFIIETVGVFKNIEIIKKACDVILEKLAVLDDIIMSSDSVIQKFNSTIENCYNVTLLNEDYTIGKILEYILSEDYYKNGNELTYVGFIKNHPHNKNSIIRLAFTEEANNDSVKTIMNYSITQCKNIINNIRESF